MPYISDVYLRSHPTSRMNQSIVNKVKTASESLDGRFRFSRMGVPHIVVMREYDNYSVTWFDREQSWSVFVGYGTDQNKRLTQTFQDVEDVMHFINSRENEGCAQGS